MAHELGHHAHHDIPRLLAMQAVTVFPALYVTYLAVRATASFAGLPGVSDPATLPVLLMAPSVFLWLVEPGLNVVGRHLEAMADRFAIELTGNAPAFISMMGKLADQNLTELDPPGWVKLLFYDHPTYAERVGMAKRFIGPEKARER